MRLLESQGNELLSSHKTSSINCNRLTINRTIKNISKNLKSLNEDHKAIQKEANKIGKSTQRYFMLYDAKNISEGKKLINDLRHFCKDF